MLKFEATVTTSTSTSSFECEDSTSYDEGIIELEVENEFDVDDADSEIKLVDWDLDIDDINPTSLEFTPDNLDDMVDMLETIDGYDTMESIAFNYLMNDLSYCVEDAVEKVEDVRLFRGNLAEYAEEFHNSCYGEIPSYLHGYVDWDGIGEEMQVNGEIAETDNGWLVTNHHEL